MFCLPDGKTSPKRDPSLKTKFSGHGDASRKCRRSPTGSKIGARGLRVKELAAVLKLININRPHHRGQTGRLR